MKKIWEYSEEDQEKISDIISKHLDALDDDIEANYPDLDGGFVPLAVCERMA